MDEIFETICTKLSEMQENDTLKDMDISAITFESNIRDDLGAESIDEVELLMALEDQYHITIETEDAENLKTIGDVVELVFRLTS